MSEDLLTASKFIEDLSLMKTDKDLENVQKYFKGENADDNEFLGVKMGNIFKLAKDYVKMGLEEIEKLLEDPHYEVRMGAVSIMDYQARRKNISDKMRKELFDLFIRRHDRINNWDLVDRAAPYVVGGYLFNKERDILYKLARSNNVWERRTAIVSTYYFIRKGDIEETFKIAEILIKDSHEFIQKAVGSWIREAGKKNETRLIQFLEEHLEITPRKTLRIAIEKLDEESKKKFLNG